MRVQCFTVGVFQVNTYLLTDEATGQSAVVDTGEDEELVSRLEHVEPEPDVRMILLTHSHLDHAGGLVFLQERFPTATTYLPRLDEPLFRTLPMQGRMFGMPQLDRPCGRIDVWVDDGATIELGKTTLRFLSTPGHTPGQGCYYDEHDVVVGDTLFAGSIGRTDFPLSDPAKMVESLRRLTELPGSMRVHSGHGPVTTLEEELRNNPFLGYIRKERGIPGPPGLRWF
ncbi:MAG: MBL fold metallo-hydrolase [Sandaracinaceae bacterium]|nr:MBL fold metallo-hydrolase [Sandaracinaceae bacterium]